MQRLLTLLSLLVALYIAYTSRFNSTMSGQSMSEGFFAAVEVSSTFPGDKELAENYFQNRRTYYGLKKESPISDSELEAIIKRCVKHSPNSFNMQQSRAVLVTGKHHDQLWDKVAEISDKNTPDEGESALLIQWPPLIVQSRGKAVVRGSKAPSRPATVPCSSLRTRKSSSSGASVCPLTPR